MTLTLIAKIKTRFKGATGSPTADASGYRAPGTGSVGSIRLCLSCRGVWVQSPVELCGNCELSPYVPPFLGREECEGLCDCGGGTGTRDKVGFSMGHNCLGDRFPFKN